MTKTTSPAVLDEARARIVEAQNSLPVNNGAWNIDLDLDLLKRLVEHTSTAAQESETEGELQAAVIAKLGASLESALAALRAVRKEGQRGATFGYELLGILDDHPVDETPMRDALAKLRNAERIVMIETLITDTEQTDPDMWNDREGKSSQLSWLRGFLRAYTLPMADTEGSKND